MQELPRVDDGQDVRPGLGSGGNDGSNNAPNSLGEVWNDAGAGSSE